MSTAAELHYLVEVISTSKPRCGPVRVIALDGGAAAGKSSLAAALVARLPAAQVLHLDDLLDGWAGQFDFAGRLRDEVLRPLAAGRPASFQRYDWATGKFAERVPVLAANTLIVEGVSAIDGCAGWQSTGIFLDLPRAERERRWVERDGPLRPRWLDWLDAEDRYFARHPLPPDTIVLPG
ncbi:MAG: hypothetical protein ABI140_06505 [Jatrophihabitantaceae bacterium]